MAVQLTLNLGVDIPTKRVRYEIPTYNKFYSLLQYDREKFRLLMNEWLDSEAGQQRTEKTLAVQQKAILEKCYIKDYLGRKLRDSDEKHIFRYKTFEKISEEIYNYVRIYYMQHGIQPINGLEVFTEDKQAELTSTLWGVSVKDRVKKHIELLRLLRKGFNIKEALEIKKRTCKVRLG